MTMEEVDMTPLAPVAIAVSWWVPAGGKFQETDQGAQQPDDQNHRHDFDQGEALVSRFMNSMLHGCLPLAERRRHLE